jgi:hypothetical protein
MPPPHPFMYKEHIYSGTHPMNGTHSIQPVQEFRFTDRVRELNGGVGWVTPHTSGHHLNDHDQQIQETETQNIIHISWLQVLKLQTSDG